MTGTSRWRGEWASPDGAAGGLAENTHRLKCPSDRGESQMVFRSPRPVRGTRREENLKGIGGEKDQSRGGEVAETQVSGSQEVPATHTPAWHASDGGAGHGWHPTSGQPELAQRCTSDASCEVSAYRDTGT